MDVRRGVRTIAGHGLEVFFIAAALLAGCVPYASTIRDISRISAVSSSQEIKHYRRFAKRYAPGEDAFIAVERIAEPYIRARQWDKAVEVFETYRSLFAPLDKRFLKVIELLKAPQEELVVTNLGEGINTPALEALPIPTADGNLVYFTGKDRYDCFGGEDAFVSERKTSGWAKAQNLGTRINTESSESVNSVSTDGNLLILFGNYQGSFGGGDNFYVERMRNGWGRIEHFPRPINSIYFDSDGAMSSDGKAMLFSSDRPGNLGDFHEKDYMFHGNYWGNTDIYVCIRTGDGWSDPINLGPVINTPYAERTPFLHPDGRTLYFSSDGHYGLGRMDVFKSVRLSDTSWTEWSEPVNLGKEINTAGDDWGYKVATSGDAAFFSAYRGKASFGGYDIYSITLPGAARPQAVATVRGMVTDEKGTPLDAAIKWENLATGENAGELRSNPQDGTYFIVLLLGSNYGYYAEKQGYYPVSKNIDLTDVKEGLEITEDILLVSVEVIKESGTPVRINNIFFDFDKAELKPESYPELNRLAEVLKKNPEMRVEIAGHTDDVGSDVYNLELSERRARAVVDYLVSLGCSRANLEPRGYGETRPLDINETEEGRAQNRRVEFRFMK